MGSALTVGVTAVFLFVGSLAGSVSATELTLPAPNLYQPTVFGDAQVYSLELLNLIENNNKLSQQSQFNVSSGEGQIKDLIVIGTGAKGQSSTNTAGVADDAYNTPSGAGDFFNTRDSEPTNGPTGDQTNSWEVSIASLITYLTDPTTGQQSNLVFIADSNQEGNAEGQTQFFWARLQALDVNGNNVGGCFDVTSAAGDGATCAPITQLADGSTGYPALTASYVENAGDFCVSAATGQPYAPPCAAGDFGPVSNNLGSNTAEFAVVFPLLNTVAHLQALLASGATTLSLELRFNNTDGPDTFWICDRCNISTTTEVPAPASLALIGSAIIGAGTLAWRRARRAV
ncbi:MAG TPA: hypothetical protein VJU81_12540 [Methylomirabilota bacterium]|nr:hypothetical protein [Methylomirabilota bacterium]